MNRRERNAARPAPRAPRRAPRSRGGALLAGAGCAVGPDYREPPAGARCQLRQRARRRVDVRPAPTSRLLARLRRRRADALVERALAANGDVRIAQARLQESRATLQGADAEQLPNIGVAADAGRTLTPEYQLPGASRSQRTASFYDAGFTASWELDFFGRNRRASESAAAQLDASAGRRACGADRRRRRSGAQLPRAARPAAAPRGGARLDRQPARVPAPDQGPARRRARHPARRRARADPARQHRGDPADAADGHRSQQLPPRHAGGRSRCAIVAARLATPRLLPTLPVTDLSALPLGTPEQLLAAPPRPGPAERQLAAATADIGVATADLFPRINLVGLIGFATNQLSGFGQSTSQQYSLAAGLTWPLLDFGRVRSRISASEARALQALASYEQTVAIGARGDRGRAQPVQPPAEQADKLATAARSAEQAARLSRCASMPARSIS